jgi:hypothetical protein
VEITLITKSRLKLFLLFLAGAALMYFAVWLKSKYGTGAEDIWWAFLIRPIGEALVVGSLVGTVVDEGARLSFLKDVTKEG